MTLSPQTEGRHVLEFLMTDRDAGTRHLDIVTYDQNQTITSGMLIAQQSHGVDSIAARVAVGSPTGNGTTNTPTITDATKIIDGLYRQIFDAATKFKVFNPNGDLVGTGTTGVAFNKGGVGFTDTAGGTPYAQGDEYTYAVTMAAAGGYWTQWAPTATDGTQTVGGIAGEAVTTGSGVHTKSAAVTRSAEVNGTCLTYPAPNDGPTQAAGIAGLKALGIIVR